MASWTSLDLNGLLPGKPLTSQKALAFEENPRAIAEGASTAPVVRHAWHSKNDTTYGQSAKIWDFTDDGAVFSVETPDFQDGYEYMLHFAVLGDDDTSQQMKIELYDETAAAYDTAVNITSSGLGGDGFMVGRIEFPAPRLSNNLHFATAVAGLDKGNDRPSFNITTIPLFNRTNATKILKARISSTGFPALTGDRFLGGSVWLMRRRDNITAPA